MWGGMPNLLLAIPEFPQPKTGESFRPLKVKTNRGWLAGSVIESADKTSAQDLPV